jgi:hypothetical protein
MDLPVAAQPIVPWLGRSLPRVEDAALLTGRERYFDDTAIGHFTLYRVFPTITPPAHQHRCAQSFQPVALAPPSRLAALRAFGGPHQVNTSATRDANTAMQEFQRR